MGKKFIINNDNCESVLKDVRKGLNFKKIAEVKGEGEAFRTDLNFLINFIKLFEKRYKKFIK